MNLQGAFRINVSPSRVRTALADPETLSALLPGDTSVTRDGPGSYGFTLKRNMGFFEFTQKGKIALEEPAPERQTLRVQASNLLGGSVTLRVDMVLEPLHDATRITYSGQLDATGLAGKLLADREAGVQPYINRVFQQLKTQIEATPGV